MPVIQHGFLRSKENVVPVILNTTRGVWENVIPQYLQYLCMVDVIIIHIALAVVIALDIVAAVIALADVITNIICIILICGRCYCQGLRLSFLHKADVFAFVVVDVNHM